MLRVAAYQPECLSLVGSHGYYNTSNKTAQLDLTNQKVLAWKPER
jgi:hypothetical protein